MAGEATTTEELAQFITNCIPANAPPTSVKTFDYGEYLNTAKNSGNVDLIASVNTELELLKKTL